VEVLVATGRAFDKIVSPDETHELEQIIAEGEYYGMQTLSITIGIPGLRQHPATRHLGGGAALTTIIYWHYLLMVGRRP
jgi:hypothetical protein